MSIKTKLPGEKYLSFGGATSAGYWTLEALTNLTNNLSANKLADWDGIAYDLQIGDAGLSSAFALSFKTAKSKGLSVLVTVSHSQPYGISDAVVLMTSFFSNSNIDYMSPQLYSTGNEASNDFTAIGTAWSFYASLKAKFIPSVVLNQRDFSTAVTYFSQFNITLVGSIQWANTQ